MYLDIDKKEMNHLAAIDSYGGTVTYGELCNYTTHFKQIIDPRSIVFCMCENTIGALVGYISFIENKVIPLLLPSCMDPGLLKQLINIYRPQYFWYPSRLSEKYPGTKITEVYGYSLVSTENSRYVVSDELSLLLTTSGSTGSPKLVRHNYRNIESNARNVASFFKIKPDDRPMADLPIYYTMGLNVICSHLYGGATVLLTPLSLISKEYWNFFSNEKATTFTGIPYSYEVLKRLRFTASEWPHLRILTQGGGKLLESTYMEFAEYAERTGKVFIPTFGQTECTARMAYLPAELAIQKCGAIGMAIPEGELFLVDGDGNEIRGYDVEGEMGYRGPNVTMGYATSAEDLIKSDEWHGKTLTGDMARKDKDGVYFIIGRKRRFLKLYGYRVNLDQCEHLIQEEFDIECACTGTDNKMVVYISEISYVDKISNFLSKKTGIVRTSFETRLISNIPRNDAGKILYCELN